MKQDQMEDQIINNKSLIDVNVQLSRKEYTEDEEKAVQYFSSQILCICGEIGSNGCVLLKGKRKWRIAVSNNIPSNFK